MPDEKKQSTVVTYLDPSDKGRPVKIHGVSLLPGKSVDLAEFMPRAKAEKAAAALMGNRFFGVEGADKPDDFDAEAAELARAENNQEAQRLLQDAEQRNLEAKQAAEGTYVAPGEAKLETAPAPRSGKAKK